MREKRLQLIITFHSTAEAMKFEKTCKDNQIQGRIIPLPSQISAGCGLAWKMDIEKKQWITDYMREQNLWYESMGEYFMV